MKLREFIQLIDAMRTAQRRYFRTRSQEALVESKTLETRVDQAVAGYFELSATGTPIFEDDGMAFRAAASDLAGKLEKYLKQDCTRFVLCQSLNNLKSLLP